MSINGPTPPPEIIAPIIMPTAPKNQLTRQYPWNCPVKKNLTVECKFSTNLNRFEKFLLP